MIAQLDFADLPTATITPEQQHAVALLDAWLANNAGWHTAAEIGRDFGCTDRQVRAMAQLSDNIISGPGSPGYMHISHANLDDVTHTCNALESQGKLMVERAIRRRRRAHQLLG
jgi:hypothetical protein